MQKFIVLVGNIGTGKTEYARNKFGKDNNYFIFCCDDYPELSEEMTSEKLVCKVTKNIHLGKNIVVDGIYVDIKQREVLMSYFKEFELEYIAIDFGQGTEETFRRRYLNSTDKDKMLFRPIHSKNKISYIKPTKQEGFSEVINAINYEIT